jgi:hypothetical protein
MSKGEFEKALSEATAFDWNDMFSDRLKKAMEISFRL